MTAPSPADVADAIAKVDRLIVAINRDLRNMPDWKRNTRFHTDRIAERRRLMTQRDYLLGRQVELATPRRIP
jgi:hypothetical protein